MLQGWRGRLALSSGGGCQHKNRGQEPASSRASDSMGRGQTRFATGPNRSRALGIATAVPPTGGASGFGAAAPRRTDSAVWAPTRSARPATTTRSSRPAPAPAPAPAISQPSGPEPARPRPDQRLRFAARLSVAIIACSAVVTFLPFGKPDQAIISAGGNAALQLGPSTTTAQPTTTVQATTAEGAPEASEAQNLFFIDMATINEKVGVPPGVDPTSLEGWVEPFVGPESSWIDGGNGVKLPDVLLRIRFCESTNNYRAANTSSSARGAYQFLTKSWVWYGHAEKYGAAEAHNALPAQQDEAALATYRQAGARPWAESRACWGDRDIDERYLTAALPPPQAAPVATPTAEPATAPPTTAAATTTSAPTTVAVG